MLYLVRLKGSWDLLLGCQIRIEVLIEVRLVGSASWASVMHFNALNLGLVQRFCSDDKGWWIEPFPCATGRPLMVALGGLGFDNWGHIPLRSVSYDRLCNSDRDDRY